MNLFMLTGLGLGLCLGLGLGLGLTKNVYVYAICSLLIVMTCVALFWYLLWKGVLEKNQIIRDLLDLDEGPKSKAKSIKSK